MRIRLLLQPIPNKQPTVQLYIFDDDITHKLRTLSFPRHDGV